MGSRVISDIDDRVKGAGGTVDGFRDERLAEERP